MDTGRGPASLTRPSGERKEQLLELASDTTQEEGEMTRIRAALTAIEAGRYVRAVTTASVRGDERTHQDLARTLREQGIVLFHLAAADEARRQRAEELEKERASGARSEKASKDEREDV